MNTPKITVAQSNAFMASFDVPPTGSGPLDGLSFAVKDLIDVAGWKTGCGNPMWRDTHPPAVVHALCIEQLLRAGARRISSIAGGLARPWSGASGIGDACTPFWDGTTCSACRRRRRRHRARALRSCELPAAPAVIPGHWH
jgi:hypothetical protein